MIFDPEKGANFKLNIKQTKSEEAKFANYDSSSFSEVSSLGNGKEIEKIISQTFDLSEFTAKDNFKSYEELKEKFESVTGDSVPVNTRTVPQDTTEEAAPVSTEKESDGVEGKTQTDEEFLEKLRS